MLPGMSGGKDRSQRGAPLKLQTTTLWHYPSQQYGDVRMGNPAYPGATPAYVIWNLLERYTRAGDLVVDPFCGGGTTLDVARSLDRRALGYDVEPSRDDIFRADARALPLEDGKADGRDVGLWIATALRLPGVRLAPILPAIAIDSVRLPGNLHPDPADRLIIATARHHGAPLLTADRAILEYATGGQVSAMNASH